MSNWKEAQRGEGHSSYCFGYGSHSCVFNYLERSQSSQVRASMSTSWLRKCQPCTLQNTQGPYFLGGDVKIGILLGDILGYLLIKQLLLQKMSIFVIYSVSIVFVLIFANFGGGVTMGFLGGCHNGLFFKS